MSFVLDRRHHNSGHLLYTEGINHLNRNITSCSTYIWSVYTCTVPLFFYMLNWLKYRPADTTIQLHAWSLKCQRKIPSMIAWSKHWPIFTKIEHWAHFLKAKRFCASLIICHCPWSCGIIVQVHHLCEPGPWYGNDNAKYCTGTVDSPQ